VASSIVSPHPEIPRQSCEFEMLITAGRGLLSAMNSMDAVPAPVLALQFPFVSIRAECMKAFRATPEMERAAITAISVP